MNTKIKELSQFAGFSSTYEQERLTKFAQLIIHECAHAVAEQQLRLPQRGCEAREVCRSRLERVRAGRRKLAAAQALR